MELHLLYISCIVSSVVWGVGGRSAVGDPGMRREGLRVAFEAWNFCNEVGQEAPHMGSPRAADCFDLTSTYICIYFIKFFFICFSSPIDLILICTTTRLCTAPQSDGGWQQTRRRHAISGLDPKCSEQSRLVRGGEGVVPGLTLRSCRHSKPMAILDANVEKRQLRHPIWALPGEW